MFVYWGPTDGGANAAIWSNTVNMGQLVVGRFATNISSLITNSTYYYRCYASNVFEVAWATNTSSFLTGDTDVDGMADEWEIFYFSNSTTATAISDYDGDGLPDVQEFQNGGNPTLEDSDMDGQSDYDEWVAGTSITNNCQHFEIGQAVVSNLTDFVFSWETVLGRYYSVLSRTNLFDGLWETSVSRRAGTGGGLSYTNADEKDNKFFRLKVENQ